MHYKTRRFYQSTKLDVLVILTMPLKVLYHRLCQYTQANEYHFDGANSIETTNH